jgi:sugar (pentulose or hexulose) kinase
MRVLLESLALRYAVAVEELERAAARRVDGIQVVGGGASHRLLCRLTADATGRPVRAGPVEATAIGNLAVQAIAAGELADVHEARSLVAHSFHMTAYEPGGDWTEARARFDAIVAGRRAAAADAGTPPA